MNRSGFLNWVAVATLATGPGVSACGGATSPGPPPPPATTPGTPAATGATPTATAGTGGSIAGIPFYRPASVASEAGGSAVLTSPDPVAKVTAYYVHVVDTGGWTTVSRTVTGAGGSLTIKKSGQGATIAIAPSGSGSVISISTYPAA